MHEETYTFVKNVSIICEVNILQSRIQHDDQNLYAIQETKKQFIQSRQDWNFWHYCPNEGKSLEEWGHKTKLSDIKWSKKERLKYPNLTH